MSGIWEQLAQEKKRKTEALVPKEWILPNPPPSDQLDVSHVPDQCGLLTKKEIEITNSPVGILLANLASQIWSSVEVTTAFAKRAIIAHQLTNCLTEIFIDRALVRAAWLDDQLRSTGKTVGPLHGLPISLKDQINIKDIESTMGYTSWIGKFAERNALLVDILESQGAVLYVKTNVPQTLMWGETFNFIFGRTANPFNRSLTSGGSSGGEGALLGLKGSPLGVGSDIGGSIRGPCDWNGLYGLRPSFNRVPYAGSVNSMEGQEAILSVLGPMSANIEGVREFMKSVISAQPWNRDPMALRKKWDENAYRLVEHGEGGQLCFGILWRDGLFHPHPPITRALEIVKSALLAKGHKVIDWEPYKHSEIYANAVSNDLVYGAVGDDDFLADTMPTGEPVIKTMVPRDDEPVKWPTRKLDREIPSLVPLVSGDKKLTGYELWQVHKERRQLRAEYLEHWQATVSKAGTGRPVDVIIAPVAPYAAPPHGQNKAATTYTAVWNSLDYPAFVLPVTRVSPELDPKLPPPVFYSDRDKQLYDFYEPDIFMNAPVSIQMVGRTQEDEAVIGIAELVDKALKEQRIA
ncbi:general amidase [Amanita muscaria]